MVNNCEIGRAPVHELNDDELIVIVRDRLEANRRAIDELRELNGELEAASRRLQEAEALKGHFLSNIRNEINNPLAAIIGFSGRMMNGSMESGQVSRTSRFIYSEALELNFQLENVFAAAGLEAGLEMPDPAGVDVAAIINEAISNLAHRRDGREIAVRCLPTTCPAVAADRRFLAIIIGNLLANALEYTPAQGTVVVSVSVDDQCMRVEVADQGPGIETADQEMIFDRFRQLDRGSCKSHRGLGLGLSVSRSLAELSGGGIAVRSAPGSGSTFSLTLPVQLQSVEGALPEEVLLTGMMERF
jgi:signal transduction histidine kinase